MIKLLGLEKPFLTVIKLEAAPLKAFRNNVGRGEENILSTFIFVF